MVVVAVALAATEVEAAVDAVAVATLGADNN
jgi:hypothetical protein